MDFLYALLTLTLSLTLRMTSFCLALSIITHTIHRLFIPTHSMFFHDGDDDDDTAKGTSQEPADAGVAEGNYDLGDDIGTKIGENTPVDNAAL